MVQWVSSRLTQLLRAATDAYHIAKSFWWRNFVWMDNTWLTQMPTFLNTTHLKVWHTYNLSRTSSVSAYLLFILE
jgi:hypothetical protein